MMKLKINILFNYCNLVFRDIFLTHTHTHTHNRGSYNKKNTE